MYGISFKVYDTFSEANLTDKGELKGISHYL